MSDRAKDGFELYKSGAVKLIDSNNGLYEFEVTSKGIIYHVMNIEGDWKCLCDDNQFRGKHAEGSFNCKHISASFYKLQEIFNESESLEPLKEKVFPDPFQKKMPNVLKFLRC